MKVIVENQVKDPTEFDIVIDPSGKNGEPYDILDGLSLLPTNGCDLIVVNRLNYIPYKIAQQAIVDYINKLRYNGSIIFTALNCVELTRLHFLGEINIATFNNILFSGGGITQMRSCLTPNNIKKICQEQKLNIDFINLNSDLTFTIKATRVKPT